MTFQICCTKPTITGIEVRYATDATAKQNRFTPGSHIPISPPAALAERRPEWVLILPWNIAN